MATKRIHEKGGVTLIPASCLHYPVGDERLIRAWVSRIQKDPSARTILMGDMLDQDRGHMRKHRGSYLDDNNSRGHDDRHVKRDVEDLAKLLAPIKDKIWGVLSGNHYYEFSSGITSDQLLCELLGVDFMGPLGLFRVTIASAGAKDGIRPPSQTITVWAHHSGGTFGGSTSGGSVNALLRKETSFESDIYLVGHDHRRIAWAETTVRLDDQDPPRIRERRKVFARVGAFLKGLSHEGCVTKSRALKGADAPTYAEEKAYRPTDLGWVEIGVSVNRKASPDRKALLYRVEYDIRTPNC